MARSHHRRRHRRAARVLLQPAVLAALEGVALLGEPGVVRRLARPQQLLERAVVPERRVTLEHLGTWHG